MEPLVPRDLWLSVEENRDSFEPPLGSKIIWEDSQFIAGPDGILPLVLRSL